MEQWIKKLPRSHVAYPDSARDRLKYWFWKVYTPFHTPVRDTSIYFGIIKHEGRQDFLLGTVKPGRSVYELISFLISKGFGNHFIAWKDAGEVVSLRRAVGFKYQYHLRIFNDGEVRCHYEYTPECHPVLHLREVGMESKATEFRNLLQDWVLPPA